MGAWYAPEIFVPSEKRILSPLFHDGYFVPPSGFLPAAAPMCKTLCVNCVMFLFGAEFGLCALLCDVQAAFGAFYRIGKQPAHLGLLNLRFRRSLVGKFGLGNSVCG